MARLGRHKRSWPKRKTRNRARASKLRARASKAKLEKAKLEKAKLQKAKLEKAKQKAALQLLHVSHTDAWTYTHEVQPLVGIGKFKFPLVTLATSSSRHDYQHRLEP